jgi:hypothetical protein
VVSLVRAIVGQSKTQMVSQCIKVVRRNSGISRCNEVHNRLALRNVEDLNKFMEIET